MAFLTKVWDWLKRAFEWVKGHWKWLLLPLTGLVAIFVYLVFRKRVLVLKEHAVTDAQKVINKAVEDERQRANDAAMERQKQLDEAKAKHDAKVADELQTETKKVDRLVSDPDELNTYLKDTGNSVRGR